MRLVHEQFRVEVPDDFLDIENGHVSVGVIVIIEPIVQGSGFFPAEDINGPQSLDVRLSGAHIVQEQMVIQSDVIRRHKIHELIAAALLILLPQIISHD